MAESNCFHVSERCGVCIWTDDTITGSGTKTDPYHAAGGGGGGFSCSDLNSCNTDNLPDGSTNKYNVQADWNESSNSAPSYINNKPAMFYFGTTAPVNSFGKDGDGYLIADSASSGNPLLGNFYKKTAGVWNVVVNFATN